MSCQLRRPKETKVHAPRFLLAPDAYLSLDRKPEISRPIPSTRQKLNIPFHLKISLYNFVMSLDTIQWIVPFTQPLGLLGMFPKTQIRQIKITTSEKCHLSRKAIYDILQCSFLSPSGDLGIGLFSVRLLKSSSN